MGEEQAGALLRAVRIGIEDQLGLFPGFFKAAVPSVKLADLTGLGLGVEGRRRRRVDDRAVASEAVQQGH